MVLWIIFPITLSLVSLIGTWTVYGLAFSRNHVCSLTDWYDANVCNKTQSHGCCNIPTISTSGATLPENSLFSAVINAGSFMFLLFCIFHHAHIMERHACHSLLSMTALVFGVVASLGAFVAGNCNVEVLLLAHHLGAAVSFTCICFYVVLLTDLTRKCALTGFEKFLYPLRVTSSIVQVLITVGYCIFFAQDKLWYTHMSAVFEWLLSSNLELFEFSYVVEFYYFSSFMISNVLSKREEEKPLIMAMS
ncbi:transmembrane protein 150A [Thalassophryne amazonica]|uniref:transmembrane protein 150A n=1 Tax=Thalassophryne amazonica TaxID=390379 RepID=UPI001471479E|nr:transmembrane protein 150A [Thalassophryne amazonica]